MYQPIALARDLIAKLFDARDERTVVKRERVKILVTSDQLAE